MYVFNEDRTRRISWISLYNYCGLQKSCESKVDSVNDQLIVTTIVNQDNTEASTTTISTRTELKEDELQTIVVLSIINSSVSLNLACQSRRNQDMKNCRRCCRIQVVIRNVTNQETWNVGMSDKGRQEQSSFRLARSSNVKTPNSTMYSNWSKDNAAFHVSHWSGAEYFCFLPVYSLHLTLLLIFVLLTSASFTALFHFHVTLLFRRFYQSPKVQVAMWCFDEKANLL